MTLTWAFVVVFVAAFVGAQEYRYKNLRSTPYLIGSLPEVNVDVGELYGGSIASNESDPSRSLFFLFKAAQCKASSFQDLAIWLDGKRATESMLHLDS